jgi:tRNA pseudouridine synthase 9
MSITPSTTTTRLSYFSRRTKFHIQVVPFAAQDQFRQQLFSFIRASLMENKSSQTSNVHHGLKKIPPYWYPYTTMTKMRWIGRELLEVVSTEFRDRSMEYYVRRKSL